MFWEANEQEKKWVCPWLANVQLLCFGSKIWCTFPVQVLTLCMEVCVWFSVHITPDTVTHGPRPGFQVFHHLKTGRHGYCTDLHHVMRPSAPFPPVHTFPLLHTLPCLSHLYISFHAFHTFAYLSCLSIPFTPLHTFPCLLPLHIPFYAFHTFTYLSIPFTLSHTFPCLLYLYMPFTPFHTFHTFTYLPMPFTPSHTCPCLSHLYILFMPLHTLPCLYIPCCLCAPVIKCWRWRFSLSAVVTKCHFMTGIVWGFHCDWVWLLPFVCGCVPFKCDCPGFWDLFPSCLDWVWLFPLFLNWARLFPSCLGWVWLLPSCLNWVRLFPLFLDWVWLFPLCVDGVRLFPLCLDWVWLFPFHWLFHL